MSTAPVVPPASIAKIEHIPLKLLDESPLNPRKTFDKVGIDELAADLKKRGLLQPVLVRPKKDRFELVFGARRLRAAKLAGFDSIDATVRELSDLEVIETQLIENGKRADIHPLEEAEAFRRLHEEHKKSVEEIAAKVGKSPATIYARLKLCALKSETAREALMEDPSRASIALLIARIPDPKLQERAAREIFREGVEIAFHGIGGGAELTEAQRKNARIGDAWGNGRTEVNEPLSYRAAQLHIQSHYMLRLADAVFDTTDKDLVKAAGACTTCPKRTGNQKELFGDVSSADVCTDPVCFDKKRAADWEEKEANAKATGQEVLSATKAKDVFYGFREPRGQEYLALDSEFYWNGKTVKVASVLKSEDKVAKILARNGLGEAVQLVKRSAIEGLLRSKQAKTTPKAAPKKPVQTKEAKEKAEREEDLRKRVRAAVIGAIVEKAEEKGATKSSLRYVLDARLDGVSAGVDALEERRKLAGDGVAKLIAKADVPQLVGVLVEVTIGDETEFEDTGLGAIAKQFGVNVEKVRERIRADLKKEQEAKEKAEAAAKPDPFKKATASARKMLDRVKKASAKK